MMIETITIFGASSAESGILGLSLEAFFIQLVTFILAILVLQRFAAKPILKKLQERRETIEQGVKLGEQMQQEKAAQDAKRDKVIADARAEADRIVANANQTGREAIQEAEDTARERAERMVAQADERIKQDTAQARQKLKSEIAALVSEATEVIIDEKVDAKKDAALIDRALKESVRT